MQQHPWVEDFANFEAVLVCTNKLPAWDTAAVMRGFQTYLFDDATTPGHESSYTHSNTGGVVRYEDGVLAIDYGHEDLAVMLPDLLSALYALGWRRAEVYHPAETIDALLDDIGRAIPAHQDFDVTAAQEKPLSEQPEARSLLSRAVSGIGDRETISAEFEALGETAAKKVFSDLASAGPIRLMDDEQGDEDGSGEIVVNINMDEEPLVPDLTAGSSLPFTRPPTSSAACETNPHADAIEREQLEAAIREQSRQQEEREAAQLRLRLMRQREESTRLAAEQLAHAENERKTPLQEVASTHAQRPAQAQRPAAIAADELVDGVSGLEGKVTTIRAGRCIFYFPPAGEASDCDAFESLVSRLNDAAFLYPGAIKGGIRWDVLDEIQPSFPWTAERLSNLAGFAGSLVASIMLALKKDKAFAGLRDVLAFVGKDTNAMSEDMLKVSPEANILLAHVEAIRGLGAAMDAVAQKLGALALCPPGDSFVDLLSGPDELAPEMTESFSVRSLVESGVSRTFVVFVDAADGPFTSWVAALLREVVSMHGLSIRSRDTVTPLALPAVVEEPVVAPAEFKQIQESISLLMAQMAKLSGGIPKAAS